MARFPVRARKNTSPTGCSVNWVLLWNCTFLSLSCVAYVLPWAGRDGQIDASIPKIPSWLSDILLCCRICGVQNCPSRLLSQGRVIVCCKEGECFPSVPFGSHPCTRLRQFKVSSNTVFLKLFLKKYRCTEYNTQCLIPRNTWYRWRRKAICQPKRVGIQWLCKYWHRGWFLQLHRVTGEIITPNSWSLLSCCSPVGLLNLFLASKMTPAAEALFSILILRREKRS